MIFYILASNKTVPDGLLQSTTGCNPSEDPATLALCGIYPVEETANPYDPGLYRATPTYSVVGDVAVQSWVATPLPLDTAKSNASYTAARKNAYEIQGVYTVNNVDPLTMGVVAAQDPASRPPQFEAIVLETETLSDKLAIELANISAAVSVDEINNIVNKPTGIIFTGRGSGLGPEDLNVSYYTEFNSVTLTEADTELYVPGTKITIPYGSGGAGKFDSFGNCFNPGDYLIQIRETATSSVIAEFEVPLNPAGEDVPF